MQYIYNCTDVPVDLDRSIYRYMYVLQHGEFILMLLWIVDLALVSYGVILPLVLEIYYVYVYCVPLFDSRLSLAVSPPCLAASGRQRADLTDSLDSTHPRPSRPSRGGAGGSRRHDVRYPVHPP